MGSIRKQPKDTRRILVLVTVGILIGLLISYFGLKSYLSKRASDKVTLTILGENSSNLQAMEALKDNYEKQSLVKLDFKPNTFEDAFNKANQDFANKTGLYDIVLQYNFSLSSFVRNHYVLTLDELSSKIPDGQKQFEKDIFPNVWKEVGYYYKNPQNPSAGDVKIAYPFAANTMLLAYNKQMFNDPKNKMVYLRKYHEELEVPTDWPHFKQVAEFFTNLENPTFGVCIAGATGGWLYYEWCGYMQGFNQRIMDKNQGWEGDTSTKVLINSAKAKEATDFFLSMKPYNAGNFVTVDGNEQVRIMKQGNVAMALVWSDYIRFLTYNAGEIDSRFGVTPVPGSKSMLAGGAFYINRQSKNPGEAIKYITTLLQKENQVALMKKGLCSPLKTAYDDPDVQNIPYIPALKHSLDRGVYWIEAGPDADLISNTVTNYLQKAWNGELSSQDALKKIQHEVVVGRKDIFSKIN